MGEMKKQHKVKELPSENRGRNSSSSRLPLPRSQPSIVLSLYRKAAQNLHHVQQCPEALCPSPPIVPCRARIALPLRGARHDARRAADALRAADARRAGDARRSAFLCAAISLRRARAAVPRDAAVH